MIASLGYKFAKKQRIIAQESLKLAFGSQKDRQEIDKIVRDCFLGIAKSGLELVYFMNKPNLLAGYVEITGKDKLDKALSKGNGVILVSAHFGNFPLLLGRLSVEGYKTAGIMRPMRNLRVEKLFMEKRISYGVKTIHSYPRNVCVSSSLRSLRDNEILFIPLDQNFGTSGVFVNFFGRKAATATGPVILASRTGSPILPCFIIRQEDNSHKIIFEDPIVIEENKVDKEAIIKYVQRITDIIESYIRKYPAEWGWIHRRWKSRPEKEGGVENG
jgi:KDO2-lipid IV(A) lauroyltransferase